MVVECILTPCGLWTKWPSRIRFFTLSIAQLTWYRLYQSCKMDCENCEIVISQITQFDFERGSRVVGVPFVESLLVKSLWRKVWTISYGTLHTFNKPKFQFWVCTIYITMVWILSSFWSFSFFAFFFCFHFWHSRYENLKSRDFTEYHFYKLEFNK